MHPFVLASANDPETAIATHADDPELAFIAGGTDLIGLMKDRAALPRRLLDINKLPDMAGGEGLPGGGLRIRAVARGGDGAADPGGRRGVPFIPGGVRCAPPGPARPNSPHGG